MKIRLQLVLLSLGTALSGCVVAPDNYEAGVSYGPGPSAYVPPTPRIHYVPADYSAGFAPSSAYFWIDDADGFAQAIGDAPPDFTFRFDGTEAWAWVSHAGEVMIIERGRDGIVQYYFAPNAAAPYLVRDVYESYGFDGPDLAVIYDSRGSVVTSQPSLRTLDAAAQLLDRGRAIRGAALDRRWDRDSATYWTSQSFAGYAFGGTYDRGWSGGWQPVWRDQRDWQAARGRHRDHDERRGLEEERRVRADHGRRFREWRRRGGAEAPPAMAPVAAPPVTPPSVIAPPAAAPRPPRSPRPPRTDMVTPVPVPSPAAPPATGAGPTRPPRNLVDPPISTGVRPLPEVPVAAEPSPALPPSRVETGVDAENPAAVAPRPPRPGGPSRRPEMMPSANRGGPEPAVIPQTVEPPQVDQAERDAMAMRRQLLEQERREREAAAAAEYQRQSMERQADAARQAEAAMQAERDNAFQREMLARREAAEAAAAARAAESAARSAAEVAARAAAEAAAREASQPRVRTNNVDEEDTQPQ